MRSTLPYFERIRVRYSDADAQGHLYFANYLVYADEVTGFFMEELGFSLGNLELAPCLTFTVNANCNYVQECHALDTVRAHVGYSRLGNSSAEVVFELYQDSEDTLLATGSFTHVFVDKTTRKAGGIPQQLRAAILQRQPELAATKA